MFNDFEEINLDHKMIKKEDECNIEDKKVQTEDKKVKTDDKKETEIYLVLVNDKPHTYHNDIDEVKKYINQLSIRLVNKLKFNYPDYKYYTSYIENKGKKIGIEIIAVYDFFILNCDHTEYTITYKKLNHLSQFKDKF